MPESEQHCKHCGLVITLTKMTGDAEPLWYHAIEYVNPHREPQYWRKCRLDFYAEPDDSHEDFEAQMREAMRQGFQLLPPGAESQIALIGHPVEVRLVIEDYNARGRDVTTLWKRVMPMSFLPGEGDDMVMDDETDMSMTVRRRWWNPDGSSTVDLQKVYIDPPENIHRNMSPAKGITFWWTDRDGGDLPEILTRNGWSN